MKVSAGAAVIVAAAAACLDTFTRPANVGPLIARLAIIGDSAVLAGHTLALQVKAWDAAGLEVMPHSLIWESSDSQALPIDQQGFVTPPSNSVGGEVPVFVTAVGRGVADTLVVHVAVPGEVKWHLALGYMPILGGPAQGPDGTIYVLGDQGSNDNSTLYAVSQRGTVRWSHPLLSVGATNYPMVQLDGSVYVVGQYVYAFAPDGTLLWAMTSRPVENPPNSSSFHSGSIAGDGTLYAAMATDLFALRTATGDTVWQGPRATDGGWLLPPTISVDGHTVYIKNTSDPLFAFRTATGAQAWSLPDSSVELSFGVGPALAGDRFIIPDASHLQEADTAGKEIAIGPGMGLGVSEPAIGPDGTRYVQVPQSRGLNAFAPGAIFLWNSLGYRARWGWYGGPALATGGILYVASEHGFYSLQLSTTGATVRWKYPASAGQELVFAGAPMIGPDGTVYTFTSCTVGQETSPCSDELFAFWEDKPVEPNSPWPMWRHDARRSGQADR